MADFFVNFALKLTNRPEPRRPHIMTNKFITNILSLLIFISLPFTATASEKHPTSSTDEIGATAVDGIENTHAVANTNIHGASANLINESEVDRADDSATSPANDQLAQDIVRYAATHLGTPYRYGSTGPRAFDCSGFMGHVFNNFDVKLNRTSRDQFRQGEHVNVKDIRPGDLMFFAGRKGGSTVGHVGMAVEVLPDGRIKFIHAATRQGVVYNIYPSDSYYGRRFLGARRVLPDVQA